MGIDIDALRRDMKKDSYGAFFGGGFGGAMMEASDIDRASAKELVRMAEQQGIDLTDYADDELDDDEEDEY